MKWKVLILNDIFYIIRLLCTHSKNMSGMACNLEQSKSIVQVVALKHELVKNVLIEFYMFNSFIALRSTSIIMYILLICLFSVCRR